MPDTGTAQVSASAEFVGKCLGNDHSRVIARVLIIAACVVLAGWVDAATLYAEKTDQELTQLAAGWDALSEQQRRALLTEIKARMQANSNKRPVLTIKTERRYGRIVRRPDGSLMRIETTEHVVRYQPLPEDAVDRPFGVGFEQRVVSDGNPVDQQPGPPRPTEAATPPDGPPVIPVGTANNR
jgi:hypothetical protein